MDTPTLNPRIRVVDEHGNTVEPADVTSKASARRSEPSAPPPFEAKALTDDMIAKVAEMAPKPSKRHKLALCMAVDCSVRDLDECRLAEVSQMVDAVAVIEGRDLPPLELLAESDDVFFGAATTEQCKPIDDRLAEIYGSRFETAAEAEAAARESARPTPDPVVEYQTMPPAMTVRLSEPFTVDGTLVEVVDLRAPSLLDVRRVVEGEQTMMQMYSAMTGLPVAALDRLKFQDGDRVIGAANLLAPELRS